MAADAVADAVAARAQAAATIAAEIIFKKIARKENKTTPQTAHPRPEADEARVFAGGGAAVRGATRAATVD